MPELPEVEFAKRRIWRWFGGQRLTRVFLERHRRSGDATKAKALQAFEGKLFHAIYRHGKFLFLGFEDEWMVTHLGMTGKWVKVQASEDRSRHARLRLTFSNGSMIFLDTRKFGGFERLAAMRIRDWVELKGYGPDVFDIALTDELFWKVLCSSNSSLKSILLNQKRLAGCGNIYACEALFRSGLSPTRRGKTVNRDEARKLLVHLRAVMHESLEREDGEEIYYLSEGNPNNFFDVYGRLGKPCRACATDVLRMVQQGRSTFYCPQCQAG